MLLNYATIKNITISTTGDGVVSAESDYVGVIAGEAYLTDFEKDIARRARNTKMNTVSKNAPLADYKKATSFEAVIGYLYLTQNFKRLQSFFDMLSHSFLEDVK